MGGGGGSKPKKQQAPGPDPMMALLAQMQSQQAAQAKSVSDAQKQALLESQRQSAIQAAQQGQSGAQEGEMGARQMLSQASIMQKAKDIAALQSQQQAAAAAGASAIGGGFDISKAREEQAANLAGTGSIPVTTRLPFYGMTDTANSGAGATGRYANIFNLPKASGIQFGGA